MVQCSAQAGTGRGAGEGGSARECGRAERVGSTELATRLKPGAAQEGEGLETHLQAGHAAEGEEAQGEAAGPARAMWGAETRCAHWNNSARRTARGLLVPSIVF